MGPLVGVDPTCLPRRIAWFSLSLVLIIGASQGIGLGLVGVHLDDGWGVHATTRDGSAPRLDPDLVTHRFDVRDIGQLDDLVEAIERPLDRIVHNAGIISGSREEIMEVNAEAPIRTVGALLEAGRLRPGGQVAIMTSRVEPLEKNSLVSFSPRL